MRANEFINEALDYQEIFKQIDAKERAGIPRKYPVIGGIERTPEVIRAEIARGGTLETEPLDHEHFQKWQQQQKEKSRAPNFLGIGDMLKSDELKQQKAAAAKASAVTVPKSTTLSQPMRGRGGGGGSSQDMSDPRSWQSGIDDVFQTSFDPKRLTQQMKYNNLKESTYTDHEKQILNFIKWCVKKLKITEKLPEIKFQDEKESDDQHRTGYYDDTKDIMWIYTGKRNLIDILRTVAHELTHRKQHEGGRTYPGQSFPGSKIEQQADAMAGILMKLYGKEHPEIIE
jgi:hypothetical protein